MTHIKRIFYPIGQGAFYSEQIKDKTIVYDCGLWWNEGRSKRAEQLVKSAFPEKHEIDILFISHFDYDHVSLIPLLIEYYSVKRIVMPLLDSEDKSFLSKIYAYLEEKAGQNNSISKLLADPSGFSSANEGIQIIEVNSAEDEEGNDPLTLDDTTTSPLEIKSGSKIQFSDLKDWVWVPYNIASTVRSLQLFNNLSDIKLDLEKLIGDSDYFASMRGKIRDCYSRIEGNVNENSLFLYSGPDATFNASYTHTRTFYRHIIDATWYGSGDFDQYSIRMKLGCIFTGDGDLKGVTLKEKYQKFWRHVGTIQIPHHGSRKSFDFNSIDDNPYVCPISVGVNNFYGHPAPSVVSTLLEKGNYPIIISEKMDSLLINIHYFV